MALREHRAPAGSSRRGQAESGRPSNSTCRGVGRSVAGQGLQQRRLAGAVRADDDDRARRAGASSVTSDRTVRPPSVTARFSADEHVRDPRARGGAAAARGRTARRRAPSGCRSAARPARRRCAQAMSAASSSTAPSSALAGSSARCVGPIASRSRCGTTMPTKPMTPETRDGCADGAGDRERWRRASASRSARRDGRPPPRRAAARRGRGESARKRASAAATKGEAHARPSPRSRRRGCRGSRRSGRAAAGRRSRRSSRPIAAAASAASAMPASSIVAIEVRPSRVAMA